MISISKKFPAWKLMGVVSNDINTAFKDFATEDLRGQWRILFFWPKDFTFVCPTEIAAFGQLNGEFEDRDARLLGVSTDSEFVHLAWCDEKEELRDLPFPMLSDIKRFVHVTDLNVGHSPDEVLRVLATVSDAEAAQAA